MKNIIGSMALVVSLAGMGFADSATTTINTAVVKTMNQDAITKAYGESFRYEAVGKYTEAIRALSEVYETYPKTYTVNYRIGWLYYSNHNYADAIASLDRALIACPSSVEALGVENLVHAARSDWASVEALSLKIIKIDYYNFYGNYWYAVSLRTQGKNDIAIAVDRKMLTIMPSSVAFLAELGLSLYLTGEKIESHSVFQSVMVLDPNNETARAYLKKY